MQRKVNIHTNKQMYKQEMKDSYLSMLEKYQLLHM